MNQRRNTWWKRLLKILQEEDHILLEYPKTNTLQWIQRTKPRISWTSNKRLKTKIMKRMRSRRRRLRIYLIRRRLIIIKLKPFVKNTTFPDEPSTTSTQFSTQCSNWTSKCGRMIHRKMNWKVKTRKPIILLKLLQKRRTKL